jgi:uncharacterized Zn finger protein
MSIPNLSEKVLRRNTNAKSFERGRDYYQSGAVFGLTQRGDSLYGEVEGSELEPYRVQLEFDDDGLTSTHCTCPYSFEGWCKHIVASLLFCLHQADEIETRPTLEQLLDHLDYPQTRLLIQELAAEQPALIDRIDDYVHVIAEPAPPERPEKQTSKPAPRSVIDPAPFRREVRRILRNAVQRWESGWDDDTINEDLETLVSQAQDFTEIGDHHNALAALAAITEACVDYWDDVGDYGADSDEAVEMLDRAWTEAILSADLTAGEKADRQKQLEIWQDALDGTFAMGLEALRQGWDYPPLRQVLGGHITAQGAWDGEPPDYADELALIRLDILERQGRHQEYLYLAEAEGQIERYLTMLARLGRTDAAMEAARTKMGSQTEAFALAQALREQGALAQALEIARSGLKLVGEDYLQYKLAIWTSELAESLGDGPVALSARVVAFNAQPSFDDYRKIQELAGEGWTSVRAELLEHLQKRQGWGGEQAKVDIFLHEGFIDGAIKEVQNLGYYRSELVQRVMDAAITQNPEWVIENARRRAEEIMDAGKANAYYHAVEWLSKARAAYLTLQRQSEWSNYRAELMQTHGRKYKLMAMLKRPDLA